MVVYLSEYIYPKAAELLRQQATVVDTFDNIEEIDAIIVRGASVTAEMMDRAKKLKVIAKHGIGCNSIDVEAAKQRGIQVIYTPTANADSVAELTVALFLLLQRRLYEANEGCRAGRFTSIAPRDFLGTEILGKTFGQIGMGNIAQRIAHIMNKGFGVKVLGYDPFINAEEAARRPQAAKLLDAGAVYSLKELLKSTIIASANDSAYALAEYAPEKIWPIISWSEDENDVIASYLSDMKSFIQRHGSLHRRIAGSGICRHHQHRAGDAHRQQKGKDSFFHRRFSFA